MVQTRKDRKAAAGIKLAQPDRSALSEETLLNLAQERNLFEQADQHPANRRRKRGNGDHDDGELSPTADRAMEALLWTVSLAMLHFTLDVLVQHQYAMEVSWPQIITRALVAFVGKMIHRNDTFRLFEADCGLGSFLCLLLRAPSPCLVARPAARSPP